MNDDGLALSSDSRQGDGSSVRAKETFKLMVVAYVEAESLESAKMLIAEAIAIPSVFCATTGCIGRGVDFTDEIAAVAAVEKSQPDQAAKQSEAK